MEEPKKILRCQYIGSMHVKKPICEFSCYSSFSSLRISFFFYCKSYWASLLALNFYRNGRKPDACKSTYWELKPIIVISDNVTFRYLCPNFSFPVLRVLRIVLIIPKIARFSLKLLKENDGIKQLEKLMEAIRLRWIMFGVIYNHIPGYSRKWMRCLRTVMNGYPGSYLYRVEKGNKLRIPFGA